jgi:hypothetical protein
MMVEQQNMHHMTNQYQQALPKVKKKKPAPISGRNAQAHSPLGYHFLLQSTYWAPPHNILVQSMLLSTDLLKIIF